MTCPIGICGTTNRSVADELTVAGTRLAQEQLRLSRAFVAGALSAADFIEAFLSARHAEIGAGSCNDYVLIEFLDDVWFAIDMHNEYDELREPDEFDDAQLLEVIAQYLADWDAGTWQFDPRWAR
jgi:hypothetical protein